MWVYCWIYCDGDFFMEKMMKIIWVLFGDLILKGLGKFGDIFGLAIWLEFALGWEWVVVLWGRIF